MKIKCMSKSAHAPGRRTSRVTWGAKLLGKSSLYGFMSVKESGKVRSTRVGVDKHESVVIRDATIWFVTSLPWVALQDLISTHPFC